MLTGGPGLLLAAFTLTKYGNIQTTICSVSLKFSAIAEAVYTYRDNQLISVNILIVYKRQENKTASGNSVVVFFFSFFFFFCLEGICRSRMGILLCQRQSTPGTPALPQPPPPCSQSRSWQTWGAFPLTKATFFSLQLDQMLQIYYQMWHG